MSMQDEKKIPDCRLCGRARTVNVVWYPQRGLDLTDLCQQCAEGEVADDFKGQQS